jgi:hypothetical protein
VDSGAFSYKAVCYKIKGVIVSFFKHLMTSCPDFIQKSAAVNNLSTFALYLIIVYISNA